MTLTKGHYTAAAMLLTGLAQQMNAAGSWAAMATVPFVTGVMLTVGSVIVAMRSVSLTETPSAAAARRSDERR